jgi:hypothetical protein
MNLPPRSSKLWAERYESLRWHFVHDRKLLEAEPLGLTLLLHQGLASWMRAWQSGAAAETNPDASSYKPWKPPAGRVWQQELTQLIAHMTVQQLHLI